MRESSTAGITISSEQIDSLPSISRGLDSIVDLATEVPGVIQVTTTFRGTAGSSLAPAAGGTFAMIDGGAGLSSTVAGMLSISCDEIASIQVLRAPVRIEFGATLTDSAVVG